MNIKSAKYYLNSDTEEKEGVKATIDNEIRFVPIDPANRHYQAILEWVAEGNTIAEAD